MYVRLGFSVAINVNPDVLLVDEVLAVGDEDFQRRCKAKFAELKDQGRTVVVVTHALDTVRDICDEAALLHSGAMSASGPASEVVEQYKSDVGHPGDGAGAGDAHGGPSPGVEHIELISGGHDAPAGLRSGDPVIVRLHYDLDHALERPVFSTSIHTIDGVKVSGTRTDQTSPGTLQGRGYVDLEISHLRLAPGAYEVRGNLSGNGSAADSGTADRVVPFTIEAVGPTSNEEGIVPLGGTWRFHHRETR
jgi:ABC-2 type transport system ATP-binding protein